MALNTTEELIAAIRQGRMVILMDDEERENEGDFVMAASCVRAEDINFMARYGRGLICLTLTKQRCQALHLPLMVRDTYYQQQTNFTVSIDAASGITTGISAADRAYTIRAAVNPAAQPGDLMQPGHIFPLMAQPGGVLTRAGHTEAGCDLARLAGFEPAAVIVEILNDDGTMARRPELEILAEQHGLMIGTIAELIRFRMAHEKTVECVAECLLPTDFGEFRLLAFQDSIDRHIHYALVRGTISPEIPTLVRVHIHHPVHDLTGSTGNENSWTLRRVLQRVAQEETGIVVILTAQIEAQDLIAQIRNQGRQTAPPGFKAQPRSNDLRTIGLGAQILAELGARQLRVLSAPKRIHSISGFGLEVVEYTN